jgi:hypothetical protein
MQAARRGEHDAVRIRFLKQPRQGREGARLRALGGARQGRRIGVADREQLGAIGELLQGAEVAGGDAPAPHEREADPAIADRSALQAQRRRAFGAGGHGLCLGKRRDSRLLARDEIGDSLDGIEVLREHLGILDADPEGLFDEGDHLEGSGRVDDATVEERIGVLEGGRVRDVEVSDHEGADLVIH